MSTLPPYTKEELDLMPIEKILELYIKKSYRLHPFCLIGQPLCDARRILSEWFKNQGVVEILIAGKELYLGDPRVSYWYCNVDENNIMTDVWKVFNCDDNE